MLANRKRKTDVRTPTKTLGGGAERRPSLRDAIRKKQADAARQGHAQPEQTQQPNARAFRMARKSGQLNMSSRDLKAFPSEIMRLHELVEEDERSWECMPLQKVDLSYNEIDGLPEEINGLESVTSFKMRHNHVSELPEAFFHLTALVSLDLSNNRLTGALSEGLGLLTNLKDLNIAGNELAQLPDAVGTLERLEILKLEENQLQTLPVTLGRATRLHTLTAQSNQLEVLPSTFALLTSLATLDLSKNKLRTVGDAMAALTALTFLDLRQNRLEEFPVLPQHNCVLGQLFLGFNQLVTVPAESVLGAKDSLSVLDMRDNKLRELPDQFPCLYRLKTLDMTNNDLHDLPPGLGYLKYLNHLLVDGNPLRSIRRSAITAGTVALKKYLRTRGSPPAGVEVLEQELDEFAVRQLQQQATEEDQAQAYAAPDNDYLFRDAASSGGLQLVDMQLQSLPPVLRGAGKYNFATSLVSLNLSKNRLVHLPHQLGELHALQTLVAEECALESIDPAVTALVQLQHLRLRKNALTTKAVEGLFSLGPHANCNYSLKELDLRNNFITDMPSPLRFLTTLDTLLLSYNRMRSLEGFEWCMMKRLSVVSIADNQLESLGTVYELPLLTSLSVENNNLRQIPFELGRCENLRALYIVGNPQRSVRINIVHEGTEAILKYLRNRLPVEPMPTTVPSTPGEPHQDSENIPPSNVSNYSRFRSTPGMVTPTKSAPPTSSAARTPMMSRGSGNLELTPIVALAAARRAAVPSPPPAPTASVGRAATPPVPAASTSVSSASADDGKLRDLDTKISVLEANLEDFAITAAKRFALKKELAMVRSQKIRLQRAMQQR